MRKHTGGSRVWTYPLPIDQAEFTLDLPEWSVVIHVAVQAGAPCLWVTCDPERPTFAVPFCWVATGHEIPADASGHLGTVQLHDDALVLHLFMREMF